MLCGACKTPPLFYRMKLSEQVICAIDDSEAGRETKRDRSDEEESERQSRIELGSRMQSVSPEPRGSKQIGRVPDPSVSAKLSARGAWQKLPVDL
jgi:hypothetical protein